MNKKILLPVFLAMMTTIAAEIAPKTRPANVLSYGKDNPKEAPDCPKVGVKAE